MNKKIIRDSVILVTGAGRGLGRAFVEQALEMGAAKIYAATRTPHHFDDLRVVNIQLDVTDKNSLAKLAAQVSDVNIVVNNAGIFLHNAILSVDMENVRREFETNVFGPIQVSQIMTPILEQNGGGTLINVHSVLSWIPFGSYGASKAALWSVTNSLRQELARQGTHVVGVHVGLIDTDMAKMFDMPKTSPDEVARIALEGAQKGISEVLVDKDSQYVKSLLAGPVENLKS